MAKFGKGASEVPPAPDPATVANAQAAANRVTTLTPTGSQVYGSFTERTRPAGLTDQQWQDTPFDQRYTFNADPTHAAMQVVENPAQTQFRTTGENIAQTLANRAQTQIGNLTTSPGLNLPNLNANTAGVTGMAGMGLQNQINTSGMPGFASAVDKTGFADWNTGQGVLQAMQHPLDYGVDLSKLGNYQTSVDTSGLQALPTVEGFNPNDFSGDTQRTQQATFGQAMNMLGPQFEQQQRQLEQRLADQGIPVGSEAYGQAMKQFAQNRDTALQNAAYQAVGAGSSEQSRLAAEQMQKQQLAAAMRGQGFSEAQTNANLANAARSAAFGENYQNVGANNAAVGQDVTQNAQLMQLVNALRGQQYGEGLSDAQLQNQAQQAEFAQALTNANLGNANQQVAFNQNVTGANLVNQAQQAQFGNELTNRNLSYNELAALLGGPQVAAPQAMAPTPIDVTSPYNTQYQGQIANANAQNQMNAATLGGLTSLAGTAGILAFCFEGSTPIDMADGSTKPIKSIAIGDKTKGGDVLAVIMAGAAGREMVMHRGVHVQSQHAVKDIDGRWREVGESDHSTIAPGVDVVWSLHTSGRRIWSRGVEFEDHDPIYGTLHWAKYRAQTIASLNRMARRDMPIDFRLEPAGS